MFTNEATSVGFHACPLPWLKREENQRAQRKTLEAKQENNKKPHVAPGKNHWQHWWGTRQILAKTMYIELINLHLQLFSFHNSYIEHIDHIPGKKQRKYRNKSF